MKTEIDTQTEHKDKKKSWKETMMSQNTKSEKKQRRARKSYIITNNTNVTLSMFGEELKQAAGLNLSRHASVPDTLPNSLVTSTDHRNRMNNDHVGSRNTECAPKITITHLNVNDSVEK